MKKTTATKTKTAAYILIAVEVIAFVLYTGSISQKKAIQADMIKKCPNVPFYAQGDSKWGGNPYPAKNDRSCDKTTISTSGCGPTSLAMVLSAFGIKTDPAKIAKESTNANYRVCNAGSSHDIINLAKNYGLKTTGELQWDTVKKYLLEGGLVIAHGHGAMPYTSGGHFVVITCYDPTTGWVLVNDSASGNGKNAAYPESALRKGTQLGARAIYGKPLVSPSPTPISNQTSTKKDRINYNYYLK